ncbi:unnamed protein product, partial [Agarophyton chilense]
MLFELTRANENQTRAVPIHNEEEAHGNGAVPITPMVARSISDVTTGVLHCTSFAGGERNAAAGPNSLPLGVPRISQPPQAPPAINAIQMVWPGNVMPTPLPQAISRSEYGTKCTTATLPNGSVMPQRRFFSLPFESSHANVRIGAEPVRARLSQNSDPQTPQAIDEPPEEVQRVATGHLLPSEFPSGALQSARQDVDGRL